MPGRVRRGKLYFLRQRVGKAVRLRERQSRSGGKQQPDETLADCLARELQEELGVEAAIGAPFGVYRHAYTHFKVTLHAFFCTLMQGEPQPLDAAQLRWVQPAELRDFAMGKIDRQIAENLLAQLKER